MMVNSLITIAYSTNWTAYIELNEVYRHIYECTVDEVSVLLNSFT
uniref:Uncharacterized protein n=1 Tax=Anguilla anguilla TaxID=7936 RepID=A0A0E9T0Z3_ANGAN